MINPRLSFQNVVSSVQRWNDEILNCQGVKERTCVNSVKHRQPKVFTDKTEHERHTVSCYGHVAVKAAPPVVVEEVEVWAAALNPIMPGLGRGRVRGQ